MPDKHRVAIGPSSFAEADRAPLHALQQAGVEIVPNPFGRRLTEDETIAHLRDVDGLVAGLEPLTERVLAASPRLKAIARVGIGMDNVDHAAAAARQVKVSNTPDEPARAVAELTVTALLALLRQLVPSDAALRAGGWKKIIGRGVAEETVLLVGFGRIGRRVAELLAPYGCRILVTDPALPPDGVPAGLESVALQDGLRQATVVSLHAGGRARLLGAAELETMPKGALLLNSARGELVDEAALVAALESGHLGGAWFDVFWQEPYTGPLATAPNVILTPHVGTYTRECRLGMETTAVRNLLRDLGL
jgi:D-3-phosphoglycerate dehydrogenase / 2-oxoglutarate reductase